MSRFEDTMKEKLLCIKFPGHGDGGRTVSIKVLPGSVLDVQNPIATVNLDVADELLSSNYLAKVPSQDHAERLRLAIKLVAFTRTTLYIGYVSRKGYQGCHFLQPPAYFGPEVLELTEGTAAQIARIMKQMERLNDDKFRLMAEKYVYALSSPDRLNDGNRFLELTTVLEMLLLPKADPLEMSYRFRLRLAKVLEKHRSLDVKETYRRAKEIYKIRSRIVHTGAAKRVPDLLDHLVDCTRNCLLLYLDDPAIFSEESLDNICLQ